jgi:hypothetical protein
LPAAGNRDGFTDHKEGKPSMSVLKKTDPKVYRAIFNETRRQEEGLELIASENYVSEAVLEAQGSVLTNKYAEGYPGKRYYGGCEFVDVAESLAMERAKALFGAEHVNVQPLSVRAQSRRHDHGVGAFPRRSSDARPSAELLRKIF